jgi:hypothetical protein
LFFRYGGEYHPDGRQFIVVCGNINYESVQTFLVSLTKGAFLMPIFYSFFHIFVATAFISPLQYTNNAY